MDEDGDSIQRYVIHSTRVCVYMTCKNIVD